MGMACILWKGKVGKQKSAPAKRRAVNTYSSQAGLARHCCPFSSIPFCKTAVELQARITRILAHATHLSRWITKDGIGTLGRFFVGGRLAQEFDDE
eukprot:1156309-Pelagomonas_calceolata.AAC.5